MLIVEVFVLLVLANGIPVVANRLLGRRFAWPIDGDISFIRKLFGNIGGINAADFFN